MDEIDMGDSVMSKKIAIFAVLLFAFLGSFYYYINKDCLKSNIIVFGQSCPMSGSSKQIGISLARGANAYFSYINENGGVNGKEVLLLSLDDKCDPKITMSNIKTLTQQKKVFALFGVVGTSTSQVVIPAVLESKTPYIAPFTGDMYLRNIQNSLVCNLRKSNFCEIEKIVKYLAKKGIKDIALFYQNDSFNRISLDRIREVIKKEELDIVSEGIFKRNTLSVGHALYEIKPSNPQAVIMIGQYKPVGHFIKRARLEGMDETLFCILSTTGADFLIEELNKKCENIIFSIVVPSPYDEKLKIAKEYRKLIGKYYPKQSFDFVSMEGFMAAKMSIEALKKCGEKVSKRRFIQALKDLPSDTFGNSLSIKKGLNKQLDSVWLATYKNGEFKRISL
jgi:ABC-type branched-subunit amino acid transport system substrate-binding protein